MDLFLIFLVSAFIVVILPLLFAKHVYDKNFGEKFEPMAVDTKTISEFPDLIVDKRSFKTDKDRTLSGFLYSGNFGKEKGLIVLAHGHGTGGHRYYLEIINFFVNSGYKVFTYDATGNGESNDVPVGGFPQGTIDLSAAIDYVKANEELKDLPIFLWGHSWGGYSVSNVLHDHPDVSAVISVAGLNSSQQILEYEGRKQFGNKTELLLPYVALYERIKFGKYSSYSALKGFENTKAKIMIIHSVEDETVPIEIGYGQYYDHFSEDPRFKFIKLSGRKHDNPYYTDEALNYREKCEEKFEKYLVENNLRNEREIKEKYFSENFDRNKLFVLDRNLMDEMVKFYDESSVN